MYIAIANFPMGKSIMDYLDATGIELDENTVFHLDNILLERPLKDRIIELNDLDPEEIKNLDYYSSAVLSEDLEKIRHWENVSEDLSVHCYLELSEEVWLGVVKGDATQTENMARAIAEARKL